MLIHKKDNHFSIARVPIEYEVYQEVVAVDIETTLSEAVSRAHEGRPLIWKLADIFAWDIDFIRDIRPETPSRWWWRKSIEKVSLQATVILKPPFSPTKAEPAGPFSLKTKLAAAIITMKRAIPLKSHF